MGWMNRLLDATVVAASTNLALSGTLGRSLRMTSRSI